MVTDYTTLVARLARLLLRTDLTNDIPFFIQSFESRAKRDRRFRKHVDRGVVTVSADDHALPGDLMQLVSWNHDGTTARGPIEIVHPDLIPGLKLQYGATGTPSFAAIIDGATAQFAPAPNATFTTYMTYWRRISSLSEDNQTNWLINDHPDIYVYGSALESAPHLKNDERLPMWESIYNERVAELDAATENKEFGGTMRRQFTPIG